MVAKMCVCVCLVVGVSDWVWLTAGMHDEPQKSHLSYMVLLE
jgi:hypothetical protein